MIEFICQQCGRSYALKHAKPRVFCACGGVSVNDRYSESTCIQYGPGDAMQEIMDELRITEKVGCSCKSLARKMNKLGIDGCVKNRVELIAELNRNSAKYSWIEKFKIGIYNTTNPLAIGFLVSGNIAEAMLDEAIRRVQLRVVI